MNLKDTYNKIARAWHEQHGGDSWWRECTNYLISLLKPGATILDVGCAGGFKSKYFADKGFKVTGIDFSEEMVSIAKEQVPNASFKVLDLFDVDTIAETFDCVFVQAVLLHVPKKRMIEVLTKLKDRVNSGGLLYIAVKKIRGDVEEEIKTENDVGFEYNRFFSYFTTPELEADFKKIGLEIVSKSEIQAGNTVWIQIIGKKV
jgi:cyclopropane fatty-acyl-phospholipid synthase-like methyltransferase